MSSLEREVDQLHSRLCAGLADPKRILLLYALAEGALNVGELSEQLHLPQPTVSRHLKQLRERGLVRTSRQGTAIFYTIDDMRVIQALDLLRAVLADQLRSQADLAETVSSELG